MLFGDDIKKRDKWSAFFAANQELFSDQWEFKELYYERELAYRRIKAVAEAKLFSIYDFETDPINLFTCHE